MKLAPAFLLLKSLFSTRSFAMQTIRNDGIGGRGITHIPSSGQYSNVVVWMHGLGDTADGWASSMPGLGFRHTKFVLPTALSTRISLNGGMAMPGWSDIFGLSMNDKEDRQGFDAAAARINQIVQKEIDGGIPANKIVIAGFSQGGALALHVALRSAHSLGGCISLSSWLPLRADYPAALSTASANLPILQVHGDVDQVVSFKWGHESNKLIKDMITSPEPKFVKIEDMGHSSDPEEMHEVTKFLKSVFGDNA